MDDPIRDSENAIRFLRQCLIMCYKNKRLSTFPAQFVNQGVEHMRIFAVQIT